MEKDATGYLSLLSHDRRTNPGTSRYLASRLPYDPSGSERGGWKRTSKRSNALAAYSIARRASPVVLAATNTIPTSFNN